MKRKYKCDNCGFNFETEKDPQRCPYCNKQTITLIMNDEEMIQDIGSLL